MSRLYFHTQHEGTAELLGSERAHMGCTVSDLATAFLPTHRDEAVLAALRPELVDSYTLASTRTGRPWPAEWPRGVDLERLRLTLTIGLDRPGVFQRDGEPLETFSLLLNTVLAIGNDSLCLFARLHAQCEIHCRVEGEHRGWMADLIDQGLASGLYRDGAGWDKVQALLRSGDQEPVVCSHSVTEGFPNRYLADWVAPVMEDGEPDEDAWYELPDDEQWRLCLTRLRSGPGLELSPASLRSPFRHGLSMMDLFG